MATEHWPIWHIGDTGRRGGPSVVRLHALMRFEDMGHRKTCRRGGARDRRIGPRFYTRDAEGRPAKTLVCERCGRIIAFAKWLGAWVIFGTAATERCGESDGQEDRVDAGLTGEQGGRRSAP